MSFLDISGCQEKPPPGCQWVTAPPKGKHGVGAAMIAVGDQSWFLDCDCRATGKCPAGEPPPPPVFEFLQRDKGSLYTDVKVSGPTEFMETKSGPYDYHWSSWHNPYSEGPGRLSEPAAQGPAHIPTKRDENPSTSAVPRTSTPFIGIISEQVKRLLEALCWNPFNTELEKSHKNITESVRCHSRDWDLGCEE